MGAALADHVGQRVDHPGDPAPRFGQVWNLGLDHDRNPFGGFQSRAVNHMRRVDAHIHDDHPTGSHPGFLQSLDDFGHALFLLQDFITQVIGDHARQDLQGGQVFQGSEGVQESSAWATSLMMFLLALAISRLNSPIMVVLTRSRRM